MYFSEVYTVFDFNETWEIGNKASNKEGVYKIKISNSGSDYYYDDFS